MPSRFGRPPCGPALLLGPTDQQLAEEAAKRQQGAKSGVIEPMFPDAPNENRLRR